jgi:hypothetical protein
MKKQIGLAIFYVAALAVLTGCAGWRGSSRTQNNSDLAIAVQATAGKDCGCGECAAKGCKPCHGKNCYYCVAKALVTKECGCGACAAQGCEACGPGCDVCKFNLTPVAEAQKSNQ